MMQRSADALSGDSVNVHRLVEAQTAERPSAVAVTTLDGTLTYQQLNTRANGLARVLRGRGVDVESRVAVALSRSADAVVAFLGVLKAGAAYVPLDTNYPAERRQFMLEDSGVTAVVTNAAIASQFTDDGRAVVRVDEIPPARDGSGAANLDIDIRGDNAAYVIYTSGSTGRPKGVVIEHRSVVDLVSGDTRLAVQPEETVLHFSPTAFDASTFEIWSALCRGANVTIVPASRLSVQELVDELRSAAPDWMFLTTGLFHVLVDHEPAVLRSIGCLITGGDVLSAQHVRSAAAVGRRVYAAYGPTETTTFASLHQISPAVELQRVPIGTPLRTKTMRVLDKDMNEVADGEAGEIFLGGAGLARGYHQRPGLTAERFVPDPFSGEPGTRLYMTGDLGRRLPDGSFEFLGRTDWQVKIRGFRVEIGEIESELSSHPEILAAAVVARSSADGNKRLAAFVTPVRGSSLTTSEVRSWLRQRLPDFMIPATIRLLDALPLDPNNKVQRDRLPDPWAKRSSMTDLEPYVPPCTELERLLAAAWAEVLELDLVGLCDNFFELGGDSLRSVALLESLRGAGITLTAGQFFENPTVGGVAALLKPGSARRDDLVDSTVSGE